MAPAQDIADILASKGVLDKKKLEEIRLEQVNTGKSAKEIITEQNLASEEEIAKAEGELWKVPFVNLGEIAFSPQALSLVSQAVAEEYNLIPFDYNAERNELSLAMANPLDLEVMEFVSKKSKAKIKPFIAPPTQIKEAIVSNYGQSLVAEIKAALGEVGVKPAEVKPSEVVRPGEVIREEKIAKVVSAILEFAIKARASDIHIEPQEDRTRVRYRIDGILHEKLALPKTVHDAVVSRIKILSGLRIDEKRIPQDGRFNFKAGEQEVDLRVSTLPTVHGEKVVMRLLKKSGGVPDLPDLGL
ncbi:MAG: GspE/PulE family protein, partial [Candidatus Margulisiibacteriota bacterium]